MASVVAVCISEKRGTVKRPVESVVVKQRHGIVGDAHAGDWHRQISLLASESVEKMKEIYPDIPIGAFAVNILTEGIDVAALPVGTQQARQVRCRALAVHARRSREGARARRPSRP